MSYRIAYKHVAIMYPHEVLNASLPEGTVHFYEPQYFLLELGGDNNLYESTSGGGCGRRVRSWDALGYGSDWEVIRKVVGFSATCEGGSLRMYSRGDISPETYIRRARNTLAAAIPFDHDSARRYGLSTRLLLNAEDPWDKAVNALNEVLGVHHDDKERQYWDFCLKNPAHAALFIEYGRFVDTRNWVVNVSAPKN